MESERSDKLALRIRIIERAKRPLAVVAAIVVGALIFASFDSDTALQNYGFALAVAIGVVAWCVVEMILAGALAIFETRHRHIISACVLPQATLYRRK